MCNNLQNRPFTFTSISYLLLECGSWSSVTWYMDTRKELSPDLNLKVPDTEFSKLEIRGNREILSKSQFDISVGIGFASEEKIVRSGLACWGHLHPIDLTCLFQFSFVWSTYWEPQFKELCATSDLDWFYLNESQTQLPKLEIIQFFC